MITWPNFVSQCFNGLALGALLALISSGLTIIYGTLGVLNLAHGAMFMLGGYAGYAAYEATGSFTMVGIGAMAAGFAGIVNAPVVSLTPDMGDAILVETFVVVVIGGVGSFTGALT